MRDDYLNDRRVLGVSHHIKIPTELLDWLRRSAYAEIGTAAEDLDTAVTAGDREDRPERFRGPAQSLRELYAVLDSIGWAKTASPDPAPIDLGENNRALTRALHGALEFADEELRERSRQAGHRVHAGDCDRVGELYNFIEDVHGRIELLAAENTTDPIADLVTVPDLTV